MDGVRLKEICGGQSVKSGNCKEIVSCIEQDAGDRSTFPIIMSPNPHLFHQNVIDTLVNSVCRVHLNQSGTFISVR